MKLFTSILIFVAFGLRVTLAADLSLVPSDENYLFGGRPARVPVSILNDSPQRKTGRLDWRLFQATSATLAPLGGRASLGDRGFPAAQISVTSIEVNPPEVRAITSFVLKVWVGDEELGRISLTVCPTNVFSQLRGIDIAVQEPSPLVEPLLPGGESAHDPKLTILRLPDAETKPAAQELAPAVLYIVGRGVQGSERLAPLKFAEIEGRRTAILQDWFVPGLATNALSQLRLLRAIDLLLKPEQVRAPEVHK